MNTLGWRFLVEHNNTIRAGAAAFFCLSTVGPALDALLGPLIFGVTLLSLFSEVETSAGLGCVWGVCRIGGHT